MRAIIIEDENLAIQLIKEYLEDYPEIEFIGEYHNGFDGLKAINELSPDLIFLDISMPKLTGTEMIELIDKMPFIIFTTAHEEYAVKAFEKDAVDYLLKPFSKKRFHQAIDKVKKRYNDIPSNDIYSILNNSNSSGTIDRIPVKEGGKLFIVSVSEIYYIEAAEDYTIIATENKEYVKHATMKFFEEKLPAKDFVRIHRSTIVNINHIAEIQPYTKDTISITMKNKKVLKSSRHGNAELKNILKI